MREFVKPSLNEVFQMIDAAIKLESGKTKGKEGVYQFQISGEEEGTFQMIIDETGPRAVQGSEKDPDVTLTINGDDFRNLVGGTLNPTVAFMSGKLKIKGNMGLAFKLQSILNSFSF